MRDVIPRYPGQLAAGEKIPSRTEVKCAEPLSSIYASLYLDSFRYLVLDKVSGGLASRDFCRGLIKNRRLLPSQALSRVFFADEGELREYFTMNSLPQGQLPLCISTRVLLLAYPLIFIRIWRHSTPRQHGESPHVTRACTSGHSHLIAHQ